MRSLVMQACSQETLLIAWYIDIRSLCILLFCYGGMIIVDSFFWDLGLLFSVMKGRCCPYTWYRRKGNLSPFLPLEHAQ